MRRRWLVAGQETFLDEVVFVDAERERGEAHGAQIQAVREVPEERGVEPDLSRLPQRAHVVVLFLVVVLRLVWA